MKHSYLEITYRNGRPLAAYYYLPRLNGDTSTRTEQTTAGLLVDFASDGRPIGIEIPSPSRLDLAALNELLTRLGQTPVGPNDIRPLLAA